MYIGNNAYFCTLKFLENNSSFKNNNQKLNTMKKYVCDICHYEYDPAKGDPDNGIAPGTAFEDLPADWVCPLCGVGKEDFSPAAE